VTTTLLKVRRGDVVTRGIRTESFLVSLRSVVSRGTSPGRSTRLCEKISLPSRRHDIYGNVPGRFTAQMWRARSGGPSGFPACRGWTTYSAIR
jgi:hypothetical protein